MGMLITFIVMLQCKSSVPFSCKHYAIRNDLGRITKPDLLPAKVRISEYSFHTKNNNKSSISIRLLPKKCADNCKRVTYRCCSNIETYYDDKHDAKLENDLLVLLKGIINHYHHLGYVSQ